MSKGTRIFWLASLVCFLSGCSGYRMACPPDSIDPTHSGGNYPDECNLETGEDVRINLIDGNRVEGTILAVNEQEIVLDDGSTRICPVSQVLSVEKGTSYTGYKVGALVLVLGAIVAAGIIIADNTPAPELDPLDIDIIH